MRTLENALRRVGFCHVAGVDEVGRGCLAGPVVAAANGDAFAGAVGRAAPDEWTTDKPRRVPAGRMLEVGEALGLQLPGEQTYLVPLVAPDVQIGTLALVDPTGESPEDRLIEAYATRTALAFRYATGGRPSQPL